MPVDLTELTAAVAGVVDQTDKNTTLEGSATAVINGFAQTLADALAANDAVDKASLGPVLATLEQVRSKMVDSAGPLSAAIVNRTPAA